MKHICLVAISSLMLFSACNYVTYTPRAKSQKRREKPSIFICERIVEFRMSQGRWPVSREDFITKGQQFYDALKGFKYTYLEFKTKDSNTMTAQFFGHVQDLANNAQTQKIDLGDYGGKIRFFKVKDRFAYKIKMN